MSRCEICEGVVYLCPHCRREIASHSHENDYICDEHSFVNPIRESDGAIISGDGWPHGPRTLGMEKRS